MGAQDVNSDPPGSMTAVRRWRPFNSIKFFVVCHSLLQLAQLLVSAYMKSSISTIERRYGLSSQKSGLLAAFNEVGNTALVIFVSFFGSRVHRPRFIGGGALLACLASLLIAMPHFLSGQYHYTAQYLSSGDNSSGLCQSSALTNSSTQEGLSCQKQESPSQQLVYPLLLLGQLLLGIGAVPIQPFGISYIDDYASQKNSPLYLGILLAVTSFAPVVGFVTGSLMLRFFVDFDKLPKAQIRLEHTDLRWVGAWWLGFLVASCFLFLTALPYMFFPREMPKERDAADVESRLDRKQQTDSVQELSLLQFLKSFPRVALRTLQSPIYLLVVLAQVNLAALLSGLATFMAKFIEKQFSRTVPFSTMMMGGVGIPLAVLGIVLGGALMRRFNLSVGGATKLCTAAILLCMFSFVPMLLIGCPTQRVAGIFPKGPLPCSSGCDCPDEAFNPVCGSDRVEFLSPCSAGCMSVEIHDNRITNYTECRCVNGSSWARPGTCGSSCGHLLWPFVVLLGLTSFIAAFSKTPSYMLILRTVDPKDKSFAVGVQYMLFRVLAFLPGPVLYGAVIDTTCILWGKKCGKQTSCHYYDLDTFRHRFLGLMVVFICGALLCFLLTVLVLRRKAGTYQLPSETKGGYELVGGQNAQEKKSDKVKT
uniref:Solute carrier organic anion transporter family member n=1 Tax=Nothobranchius korthausae TaxID=1143690 RepID=A0A1A8G446_9TELE